MAKQKKVPEKFRVWIEARKRHRLSHAQVQMARELGMSPKKLGKLDNHDQEPWKLPLAEFIEECYLKRFGKLPEKVLSIEERIALEQQQKKKRRETKERRRAEAAGEAATEPAPETTDLDDIPF